MSDPPTQIFAVLGDQLFPPRYLPRSRGTAIFMAETTELCTRVRHHQQKLVLFLSAMREYADELRRRGIKVVYDSLENDDKSSYEEKLERCLSGCDARKLVTFEIEDRFMEDRVERFAASRGLDYAVVRTPMFLCTRRSFRDYLDSAAAPRMAQFYQRQRRARDLLLDGQGRPLGGRWSFDTENRRRFPPDMEFPPVLRLRPRRHVRAVQCLVRDRFAGHPGDAGNFWYPVTRRQALSWLTDFLDVRLQHFGDYEDALTNESDVAFHSVLSPLLNIGLLLPAEVIDRAIRTAGQRDVGLNNIEGFIRQVAGWREFVRGVYRNFGDAQARTNHWGHGRRLTPGWYDGTTGMLPLDDAIRKTLRLGWAHHIERLMVVGNVMTLCEIEPREAHRWFMEMYVDSADWVMGPNVYGMALHSDGGVFATKPYICGSNYLRRMGSYGRGDWCDALDGLYWRFVDRQRETLAANPRTRPVVRNLARLEPGRRARLLRAAEAFLNRATREEVGRTTRRDATISRGCP